jgi:hypothetical protein
MTGPYAWCPRDVPELDVECGEMAAWRRSSVESARLRAYGETPGVSVPAVEE